MHVGNISLDFFEGILVGIYGNWLISLLDKINFEEALWYHFIILLASFLALAVYLTIMISKKGKITTLRMYLLLSVIHGLGWVYVYSEMGEGNFYQKTLFGIIGMSLFLALYMSERIRLRKTIADETSQLIKNYDESTTTSN